MICKTPLSHSKWKLKTWSWRVFNNMEFMEYLIASVTELEGDVRSLSSYHLCVQTSDSPYSLSYVPDASPLVSLPVYVVVDSKWNIATWLLWRPFLPAYLLQWPFCVTTTFLGLPRSSTVAPHWCNPIMWRPVGSWFDARSIPFPVLLRAAQDSIKLPAELSSASYSKARCALTLLSPGQLQK